MSVIVSDLPANREWILDERFGKVVPVGDAEALGTRSSIPSHTPTKRVRLPAAPERTHVATATLRPSSCALATCRWRCSVGSSSGLGDFGD